MTEEEIDKYYEEVIQPKMDALVAEYVAGMKEHYDSNESIDAVASVVYSLFVVVLNGLAKQQPVSTARIILAMENVLSIAVANEIPINECQQQVVQ